MFGHVLQHHNTLSVEYTKYSFFYCSPQNKYFLVHQVYQIFAHYIICFLFHRQSHLGHHALLNLSLFLPQGNPYLFWRGFGRHRSRILIFGLLQTWPQFFGNPTSYKLKIMLERLPLFGHHDLCNYKEQ